MTERESAEVRDEMVERLRRLFVETATYDPEKGIYVEAFGLLDSLTTRLSELEMLNEQQRDELQYAQGGQYVGEVVAMRSRLSRLEEALERIAANPYVKGNAGGIQSIAHTALDSEKER